MIKTRFILPDIFVVDDIFRYAAVLRGFFDGVGLCQSFGDVHVHMLGNRKGSPRRILHTALDCSRENQHIFTARLGVGVVGYGVCKRSARHFFVQLCQFAAE